LGIPPHKMKLYSSSKEVRQVSARSAGRHMTVWNAPKLLLSLAYLKGRRKSIEQAIAILTQSKNNSQIKSQHNRRLDINNMPVASAKRRKARAN
jgi:hypothetical protein